MEYHEIGERFEYDGVLLEVVEYNEYVEGDVIPPCYMCFFNNKCTKFPTYCTPLYRKDREYAYYKLVEQCKTDYTWGNTNSKVNILGGLAHLVREEERKEWDKLPLEAKCNKTKDMEQKNEEPQSKNNSIKNDRLDDKLRWELLPLEDVEDIVRVYTAGAKKYGENKWQDLPDGIRRYKAALLRHLVEFDRGNEIDKETGCLHLAQVAWNAIAMLHISKKTKQQQ